MMRNTAAVAPGAGTLVETMAPAMLLLAGVPVLTALAMTAIRYVASGRI